LAIGWAGTQPVADKWAPVYRPNKNLERNYFSLKIINNREAGRHPRLIISLKAFVFISNYNYTVPAYSRIFKI